MNEFVIATTGYFDTIECDFYKRDGEMFMTINQLARALGYASKDSMASLLSRNTYLDNPEFSTTCVLQVVEGSRTVNREMSLFTEDGIYEVSMLSGMPKARLFRAWVRKLIKAYRHGEVTAINPALKAAEIISKTTKNNLPYVLQALRQAGLNFETTTAGKMVVDDRLTGPTDDVVIQNNLNFKMDKNQWLYLTASDIAYALFGDRNKARTVGKILTDIYGYKPKNSGILRHFRIVRGVKQYFVPLKI